MLRWGRATLLVLRAGAALPTDRSAIKRAAACGVHVVFVDQLDALASKLDGAAVAAVAICPARRPIDSMVIAAGIRRRVAALPVAVVLGPSRLDGGPARILWVARHAVAPAIARAVADIVELQRGAGTRCASGEIDVGLTGPRASTQITEF